MIFFWHCKSIIRKSEKWHKFKIIKNSWIAWNPSIIVKSFIENRARNSPRDDQHTPSEEKNLALEVVKKKPPNFRKGLYISRKHFWTTTSINITCMFHHCQLIKNNDFFKKKVEKMFIFDISIWTFQSIWIDANMVVLRYCGCRDAELEFGVAIKIG